MTDVVSIGGAGIDYLVRTETLPSAGQCLAATGFHEGIGGKGANQAVAAARLGVRTALVAAIGDDARGDRVASKLEAEHVACDRVIRVPGVPTATVVIEIDDAGEKQVAVMRGANASLSIAHVAAASDLIRNAGVVLVQFEIPPETAARAVEIAAEAGRRVILDASPAGRLDDRLLSLVYGVKANAHEAAVLTGIDVRDGASAREAARSLAGRGVRLVAIEAGDEGNLFVVDGVEVIQPRYEVTSIDATGAGDAMVAALAFATARSMTVSETARFASAAAALATTMFGGADSAPASRMVQEFLGNLCTS